MPLTIITKKVADAARFIKNGQLVAFPTETVYGLGADATNEQAVRLIFEAKGRPANNPLIVHIADFRDLTGVAESISPEAMLLMKAFFPGPLTLVLERNPSIPGLVSAGLPTVGVRMPAHETAAELIRESGCPIAAPSANISGRPSPTTWRAVKEDLDGKIACILRAEQAAVGLESTVVDCTRSVPVVLRSGNVTLEQLLSVVPSVRMLEQEDLDYVPSPGILHKHYSPKAEVILVADPSEISTRQNTGYIGITGIDSESDFLLVGRAADVDDYAYQLFEFFRKCDRLGARVIYCQKVKEAGMGVALMDRLGRAARG